MSDVDYEFKIVIVGRWGVGKSAFMTRYCDNEFKSLAISTVGVDFRCKSLRKRGKIVKLKIWDTMGHERYDSITENYLRDAVGVILMFDLTEVESALVITRWVSKIHELAWENARAVLVGNKSDLIEDRKISEERGLGMAQFLEVKYFESSTKDDVNIDEAFDFLVESILDKMAELNYPHFHPNQTSLQTPHFHPQGNHARIPLASGHPHRGIRLNQNPVPEREGKKCMCK